MPIDTIASAAAALRSGTVTSADLVEASLRQIERNDTSINAFISVDSDNARRAARVADDERAAGTDRGPLHGIPLSLKDLIDVEGVVTSAGSRVLSDRVASKDATVVTRLRRAGAVILGKTNLHEFALGTTSDESAFGPVKHPLDAERSPGGSSGGSAAAVAIGMGLGSIGTDTGGSVRVPAAVCGIVGLKPSAGEVPREGVIPLSWSLDYVGPLGRTVQDVSWMWSALADRPFAPADAIDAGALRLRHLNDYFSVLSPDVGRAFEAALGAIGRRGASIEETSLPLTEIIAQTYSRLVLPEAALWHARYLATRADDYVPGVRTRIENGRSISAVDYLEAKEAQRALRAIVDAALADCDALVLPTLPIVAPPIGTTEIAIEAGGREQAIRAVMLKHTQLFNLTGHPAISLPVKVQGLPVGLQLVGARDRTADLLALAASVEAILIRERA